MNLHTPEGASAFLQEVDGFAPTPDQLAVIMGGPEPSLVIAGAGAGKTKTMALRVVYHVAAGHVDPGQVLGLTFTKKAANELSTRIAAMLRKAARLESTALDEETVILSRPIVATYNAFAANIASEHGLIVGVDPSSRLITDAEQYQIIHDLVRNRKGGFGKGNNHKLASIAENVKALAAAILNNELTTEEVRNSLEEFDSHLQDLGVLKPRSGAADVKKHFATHEARLASLDVVDQYLAYKKVNRLTEYADQVAVAHRVLQARPDIVHSLRDEHRLVLLDEYQDTSVNQAKFLADLFAGGHDVTAVGDPNQAIYGWRGASADALADFTRNFADPGKKMPQYSLATAFRNKGEILEAANAVAAPLRRHAAKSGLNVAPLEAFNTTGGEVQISFEVMKDDSFKAIARDIDEYRRAHAGDNKGQGPSIAVLCRARKTMKPIADALTELGIPFIEHGNQSAITQPEVKTIRGLLRAVSNPPHGEAIMRMLAYLNISPADIQSLNLIRKERGYRDDSERSFVEVLDHVESSKVSPAGKERLGLLNVWLKALTEARYSRLEDLVGLAVRLIGIETEVAARSATGGIGRASLLAFQRLAAGYSENTEGATLEAFLDWLDLVEEKEHGGDDGDLPLADLALESESVTKEELENPNTVTIMTVHGAKGLEWDYVAIPELRHGGFDLLTQRPRGPWLTNYAKIPTWLQEDAHSIPEWRWKDPETPKELNVSYMTWLSEDMADHENREIRRLAYVAMTRPRSRLLLAGYWFERPEQEKAQREAIEKNPANAKRSRGPSRLLLGIDAPLSGVSMTEIPEVDADETDELMSGQWMADMNRGATEQTREAAEFVAGRVPRTAEDMSEAVSGASGWVRESLSDLLALLDGDDAEEFEIGHLTANGVVQMAADPVKFRTDLERPIPTEPARAARLGQQIHEYIASRYGAPRTADLIDVSGDADQVLGLDLNNPRVAELIQRFESIPFVSSGDIPVAVEAPVDVVVAGIPMRGTVDAVFSDGTDPETGQERLRIVDWKTGRCPSEKDMPSRELQLHLYRLAWSRTTGVDQSLISATFAYLGEKDEAKRLHHVDPIPEEELETIIGSLLEQVKETA
ncbi:UvrD-helicase domain-containing protein [Flaviflexus sp.]|uniref:UvrD-helicase domain-containing protein n=1 Tax=Flaviflexus sp. TaxID=1969482 RepID=UPI003F8FDDC0